MTVAGKHILIDFGGFSAHADRDELVNWYRGGGTPEHTILVHGEDGAREALAGMLRAQGATSGAADAPRQLLALKW